MAKKQDEPATAVIISGTAENVPIGQLKQHPQNYRKGDLTTIVESMQANGFYGRLIVQRSSHHILAGNHRWLAAQQVGIKEVPVEWVDVDDATALRILLVDNRASDKAENDDEALAELLRGIAEVDDELSGTGWTADEFASWLEASEEAGDEPPTRKRAPKKPTSDNYSEQYGVTVICTNEEQQKAVYEQLTAEGHTCKVVTT